MKNIKKLFAIIFTVILVMGFIGCGDADNSEDLTSSLRVLAQEAVKTKLKAPSTGKFAWSNEDYKIKELATGDDNAKQYVISSYVDAENSLGAQIRNRFVVKVQLTSDLKKAKVLDVKIMES